MRWDSEAQRPVRFREAGFNYGSEKGLEGVMEMRAI